MMVRLRARLAERFFGGYIEQRVKQAVQDVDERWWQQVGLRTEDRPWYEARSNLQDALDAWRTNPLARRIVSLTTDYVVGEGIRLRCGDEKVQAFLDRFWHHPQNRMDMRLHWLCDELTRSGELFLLLSRNPADGMSYVRAIPALHITQVHTDEGDAERELWYRDDLATVVRDETAGRDETVVSPGPMPAGQLGGRMWPSPLVAAVADQVVLHYAINRPVGCTRGEGDLAPILPWLRRYREWLEDRVRVNRYRNAFLWKVTVQGASDSELRRRRAELTRPPPPGSVIVTNEGEKWEAVNPQVQAQEAESDGKALRLIIAAGAGVPLHFLAEGESATRATAAEMGDPTFRHYRQRQMFFCHMLEDLAETVLQRAALVGKGPLSGEATVPVVAEAGDITREDNLRMAQAAREIAEALAVMTEHGWVDEEMAQRWAYRFAGEQGRG
ncbi:MAG: hypothetical protein ACYC5O_16810 [Anaerolineae bacterium]